MLNTDTPELQFAIEAVRRASLLAKHIQSELVAKAITKDDRSPVTVADFAAQALVGKMMAEHFPETALVGEEDSAILRQPEQSATLEAITRFLAEVEPAATPELACQWIDRGNGKPGSLFWTLDPIDGTKGFLRDGQYAVALALIDNGNVQIGVLGCPHVSGGYRQEIGGPGSLVAAVRNQGAWTTPLDDPAAYSQLHVSDIADAAQARLLRSFEGGHTNVSQLDRIVETMATTAEPGRLDSQAKYAILAAGEGDLLFRLIAPKAPDYKEKIWDQAAGSLVVEEAGGRVTDLDGKPLDFSRGRTLAGNRGVLASNALLHEAALEAIKTVGA
jgi:3'(2'), 5'-bisphosphate nucleotidase